MAKAPKDCAESAERLLAALGQVQDCGDWTAEQREDWWQAHGEEVLRSRASRSSSTTQLLPQMDQTRFEGQL